MLGAASETLMMAAKFRGCLIGALVGDCVGAPFEGETTVSRSQLQKYLDKLHDPSHKEPVKQFTDDTAMTVSVAESLLQPHPFDETDLAKRFVKRFYDEPRRGYGGNVVEVFERLRREQFRDPLAPGREQFGGSGSFGNGGAMRIAPVAIFSPDRLDSMINLARRSTLITHTNRLGVNGALLQCAAVQTALNRSPNEPLDTKQFTAELIDKMADIEKNDEVFGQEEKTPYCNQMRIMERLLREDPVEWEEDVPSQLGNSVAALYSVPTAIYCFLRSQQPVDFIKTENPFRRALHLSIQMGGDTDTIASMACAISGAYHGDSIIDSSLQKRCEGLSTIIDLADRLYAKSSATDPTSSAS